MRDLNSSKNGTNKNLKKEGKLVKLLEDKTSKTIYLPFEEDKIHIAIAFGQKVSQNSSGITATNLTRRVAKVNALDEIPHLSC